MSERGWISVKDLLSFYKRDRHNPDLWHKYLGRGRGDVFENGLGWQLREVSPSSDGVSGSYGTMKWQWPKMRRWDIHAPDGSFQDTEPHFHAAMRTCVNLMMTKVVYRV